MRRSLGERIVGWTAALALSIAAQVQAQDSKNIDPTKLDPSKMDPKEIAKVLADNPPLFLKVATKAKKWEEPAEPVKIGGPIYFVGTKGPRGVAHDYRRTFKFLGGLAPDIWLAGHADTMGFDAKAAKSATDGAKAWVDPDGYKKLVAGERQKFDAEVKAETTAQATDK